MKVRVLIGAVPGRGTGRSAGRHGRRLSRMSCLAGRERAGSDEHDRESSLGHCVSWCHRRGVVFSGVDQALVWAFLAQPSNRYLLW